jgi:ATP-binding cassette subfamily C protein
VTSSVFTGLKKLFSLLENPEKKLWGRLVAFSVLNSVLESITAVMVMIFAQILNKPQIGMPYFEKLGFENISASRMIFYMAILVGVTFFVKSSLALLESFYQNFSVQKMNYSFKKKLLKRYSDMDYGFYLTRNSSEWYSVISSDIEVIFSEAMISVGILISEGLIFVSLLALMVGVKPVLALVLFGIGGGIYWGIKKIFLPFFYVLGKNKQRVELLCNQHLLQFFHAFKEIVLLKKRDMFIQLYGTHAQEKSRLQAIKTAVVALPRLVIEVLFMSLFVIAVSYLCFEHDSPQEIMGILGGYLYMGFRLMPGLNRMIGQLGIFKSSMASIERVYDEYHHPVVANAPLIHFPNFSFEHSVVLNKVSFQYLKAGSESLSEVNFSIQKGECVGIVGETGSGKSTLVDLLLGLLRPTSGYIGVDGQYPVHSQEWHALLSYVPQSIYLVDASIAENIAFGEEKPDVILLEKVIEIAQLRPLIQKLPEGIHTLVGERGIRLSGGERQRIAIARALYRHTPVLILDEATSALDNETEERLMNCLYETQQNRTLILVAHRLSTLKRCDKIVVLNQGKIEKIVRYSELVGV